MSGWYWESRRVSITVEEYNYLLEEIRLAAKNWKDKPPGYGERPLGERHVIMWKADAWGGYLPFNKIEAGESIIKK